MRRGTSCPSCSVRAPSRARALLRRWRLRPARRGLRGDSPSAGRSSRTSSCRRWRSASGCSPSRTTRARRASTRSSRRRAPWAARRCSVSQGGVVGRPLSRAGRKVALFARPVRVRARPLGLNRCEILADLVERPVLAVFEALEQSREPVVVLVARVVDQLLLAGRQRHALEQDLQLGDLAGAHASQFLHGGRHRNECVTRGRWR